MHNYNNCLSSSASGVPVHAWNNYSEWLSRVPGEGHSEGKNSSVGLAQVFIYLLITPPHDMIFIYSAGQSSVCLWK